MQIQRALINILKAILFVGFGVAILYLLFRSQNADYQLYCEEQGIAPSDCNLFQKIIGDFKTVNYFWIGLVLLAFTISNISRAARWNMLLRPLGYQPKFINSFLTIMLGYFANLGFPRVGEVVRAGSLARYENIPAEKAIGTVVVDRIVDMMSLLIVIGLAFLLEFNTLWGYIRENVNLGDTDSILTNRYLWLLMTIGLSGLTILLYFRTQIITSKFGQKIINLLKGFLEGIRTISQLERPWLFVLHSINIWVMYYLMTYLAFFSFAPTAHLTPLVGLMVFVFGSLGIVVPAPGGMGAYQGLVTVALGIYGVEQSDGFSFANIVFFSIQIGCNVFFGLIALIVLPLINKGDK